ncbi:MAG: hypothetical protein BZY82_11830 [SAR202 cluster bacterium Io17-Chloro-G3]|nr:MAG: hypothetical protein BZY82_11830 [SAR202 cluster bacterium Io17-Chloro-G3]
MNKTRRMAIMKQRRKKKKYELRRKEAILAGGGITEIRRPRPARPKTVGMPLQEAVVAATGGTVADVTSSPSRGKTTRSRTPEGQSVSTKPTSRAAPKVKSIAEVKGTAADKKKDSKMVGVKVDAKVKAPAIKSQTTTMTKSETKAEASVPAKAKARSVAKKKPEPKAKKAIANTQASTVKPKTSTKVAAKKPRPSKT